MTGQRGRMLMPSWLPPAQLLQRLRDISERRTLVALNVGAGVQSTTLVLLAALGEIPRPDVLVFADTGWEPQAVYDNLDWIEREVAGPAELPLVRVSAGNLRADALRTDGGHFATMPLHVRTHAGGLAVIKRQCTATYKVRPIQRMLRAALGASISSNGRVGAISGYRLRLTQIIGFGHDEQRRVDGLEDNGTPYTEYVTPLIDMGWSRKTCQQFLTRHGRPNTAKSACIGCPFSGNARWRDTRDQRPAEWADACEFDEQIRHGHPSASTPLRGRAYLHRSRVPLAEADIDRVTRAEWKQRQVQLDVTADGSPVDLDAWEEDPPGCSPFGCRTTEIPISRAIEAGA